MNFDVDDKSTAYIYYNILNSDDEEFPQTNTFEIDIIRQSDLSSKLVTTAKVVKPGLLRISIPANLITENNKRQYFYPDIFLKIEDKIYGNLSTFSKYGLTKIPMKYKRSFEIFSEGSVGIDALLGGIDAGSISVAMAKLSVKGKNGLGMKFIFDENDNLIINRKINYGIAAELNIPSISIFDNSYQDNEKSNLSILNGKVDYQKLVEQSITVSDLNLDENKKNMIQTGYILESISVGNIITAPYLGTIIKSILHAINEYSGIDDDYRNSMLARSNSTVLEMGFGVGFKGNIGAYDFEILNSEFSGTDKIKQICYDKNIEQNNNIKYEDEITVSHDYDFSLYNFGFGFNDGIELGAGNFSLFSSGTGDEYVSTIARDKDDNITELKANLTEKINFNKIGINSNAIYYSTEISIPGKYSNYFQYSLKNILNKEHSLNFNDLPKDIDSELDNLREYITDEPITIKSKEIQANINEVGLDFDLGAVFGAGFKLSLGAKIKCLDELEYDKKTTILHQNKTEFLLASQNYDELMKKHNISDVLKEIFAGVWPLIKESAKLFYSEVTNLIVQGISFESDCNFADNKVSMTAGIINANGSFKSTAFSADSPRIVEEDGQTKIKEFYFGINVNQNTQSKKGDKLQLDEDTTYVILVSDCVNLSFIPEYDSTSVKILNDNITLKMFLNKNILQKYGFNLSDTNKVQLYKFIDSTLNWVEIPSNRNRDTLTASVKEMTTYALAIEVNPSEDTTPPSINGLYPPDSSIHTNKYPTIRVRLNDNQFGSGIDFNNSFMIINGDTVNYTINLETDSLQYRYSSTHYIEQGWYNVKIIATDNNGNINTDSTNFYLDFQTQSLPLSSGWNLVSSYIVAENDSLRKILEPIQSNLLIAKNGRGQLYYPAYSINQIGKWKNRDGYQIYMTAIDTLEITGMPVSKDTLIYFNNGWTMVGYPRKTAQAIATAFTDIESNLLIAKNDRGQLYYPAYSINQIGNLLPGDGYMVYMFANDTLDLPGSNAKPTTQEPSAMAKHLISKTSPLNMNIIIETNLPDGWEIGAYNINDELIGAGAVEAGKVAVTIYEDDENTKVIDGGRNSEIISFKAYNPQNEIYEAIELTEVKDVISNTALDAVKYETNALLSAKLATDVKSGEDYSFTLSPNPAKTYIDVDINLTEATEASLTIYDLNGKAILNAYYGTLNQGGNSLQINCQDLPNGVYNIMLQTSNRKLTKRFVVER